MLSQDCRPLKSPDFVVRLTVFSSISRSHDETDKSHDKYLFCIISFLAYLGEFLGPILCKSIVKLNKPGNTVHDRLSSMTIYRTAVPN